MKVHNMLSRLANVVFYATLLIAVIFCFIGLGSFNMETLMITLAVALPVAAFGWAVRYILTGEKYLDPDFKSTLDQWLKTLQSKSTFLTANDKWSESPVHPWRRYFARILDLTLNGFIVAFIVFFFLAIISPYTMDLVTDILNGALGKLIDILITTLMAAFLTAIFIGYTGTSIGKWFFGLKVVDKKNRKLGFSKAWKREIAVWVRGLGCGIPIVCFFTVLSGYKHLTKEGKTSWDKENNYKVIYRSNSTKQVILGITGFIIMAIAIRLINY